MQFEILLRVLDQIRLEAPASYKKLYNHHGVDQEKTNQERARAFIHLYMKVMFGEINFDQREKTITDGPYDGGIDAYYIHGETKAIYFIQSKFRATEVNFREKEILLSELLSMDISRILEGEDLDEAGNAYNGKIKQLQREISNLPDVARYNYKVIVLANIRGVTPDRLRRLTGGYAVDVFDFERSYARLLFPVITGNYFEASDITIPIDLSNKSTGSKISYNVQTRSSNCEITVLFVPTLEIARIMHKYKNAILKFNPRSYLDLEGHSVNSSIRETILKMETNEFALFNNGITMLSDDTNINERIGQKNKARLQVKNPQIINGGQTSFTLSRIYAENIANPEPIFSGKEVLLKIITLIDDNSENVKLELIDQISNATNKQTPVFNADKLANEAFHIRVQSWVFQRDGLLYERKRGEFSDGIYDKYIDPDSVVERNQFWRLYYSANGQIDRGFQKRLFQKNDFSDVNLDDPDAFSRARLAIHVFRQIKKELSPHARIGKEIYGRVYAYIELFHSKEADLTPTTIRENLKKVSQIFQDFIEEQKNDPTSPKRVYIDKKSGTTTTSFSAKENTTNPTASQRT